tara:strand:- start:3584 stop:3934 length:351 start_codon:yes stop_codon:yes gene_type:complete
MSKHWKNVEARVARCFGTERTPLSGGNSKHTRSDSLHPRLFIETKHRKNSAAVNLYKETVKLAKKENKIPLLALHEKGSCNYCIVCDIKDLIAIAREVISRGDMDVAKQHVETFTD